MASAVICLAINQKFNFSKYICDNMVKNLKGGVKFLMYPRFVQVFMDKQVEGMSKQKEIYVTPSHTKKVFANMKRQGKDFSGRDTPLFPTMIVQAQEQVGEGSEIPTDSHHTPTTTQPSTSKPQKKHSKRKQRKDTKVSQPSGPTEPMADETENVESIPTHSNDLLLSGEDRLKLNELMELCTSLSQRVLDLEKTKTSQAAEITELKKRVKKLEGKKKSKPPGMKRLFKIGRSGQVVSSEDEGLGDQEDASKQGRKIADIDADAEVTLVDETQGRNDEEMFDTGILDGEEVFAEQDVVEKEVSTSEVATDSTTATTVDELTLAQTLIEIKAAKPKDRGVVVQEPSEFTTTTSPSQPSQLLQAKDKGKAKMVEPEKPLKKKDQIMFDKEVAQKLQAQLDADLEEEEKLARQREEDANIAEWDNIQAMMDADYELAARLQEEEQGELTIEEKSRLFVELMNKRKKHFARLRAEMLFDKEMKRVNTFVDMDTELVIGSETRSEGSSKRAGEELKSENLKKQKLDENVEAEVDDDQEEAEMKKHIEIVPDDESIEREDLETLWKLVNAKHGLTRPEEAYEKVLWGDLKVMFEPDVESEVWRRTQSDNLEAIFFKWSTFCEISKSAYRYAVTAAKLVLLVTTAERLQLLEEFLLYGIWFLRGGVSDQLMVFTSKEILKHNDGASVSKAAKKLLHAVTRVTAFLIWKNRNEYVRMEGTPERKGRSDGRDVRMEGTPEWKNFLQSKIDQTSKISKSVFISNFPDDCSSMDLWKVCNGYGTVVDAFIPNKRSKAWKHFAFARFINVLNLDRLIENLKTIWIGRFHLSTNPARFERPKASTFQKEKPVPSDDSCLVNRDLTNCVMGEVLQFSSINNLHVLLSNEGFHNTRVVYLRGLWVMIELKSSKSKSKFMKHVGVASWFRHLCNAQSDFAAKERIIWVDVEGVPLNAWTRLTFQNISSKWGELVELEDGYDDLFARKHVPEKELFSDDESAKINEQANNLNNDEVENASEVVSDTYFGDNGEVQGFEQQHGESNDKEVSSDPFNIYDLLNKRTKKVRTRDKSTSIPLSSGFHTSNDIPDVIIKIFMKQNRESVRLPKAVEAGEFSKDTRLTILLCLIDFYADDAVGYLMVCEGHLLGLSVSDNCVGWEAAKYIGCLINESSFKYSGFLVGDNMFLKSLGRDELIEEKEVV
ncbi:RNA-directed DNA polymerase, eukaryota, nucleotide-binding alpha-beta plait domain protein [Tanacetum coccineum]